MNNQSLTEIMRLCSKRQCRECQELKNGIATEDDCRCYLLGQAADFMDGLLADNMYLKGKEARHD
jgi:hypothetical protein